MPEKNQVKDFDPSKNEKKTSRFVPPHTSERERSDYF